METATGLPQSELEISQRASNGNATEKRYGAGFTVGRQAGCDYVVDDPKVSRRHFRCVTRDGEWWIEDLGSSNGTFLDGKRLEPRRPQRLGECNRVTIGPAGRPFDLRVIGARVGDRDPDLERRYLDPDYEGPMGERTAFVRAAVFEKQKKERRKFRIWLSAGVSVLLVVAAIAGFQFYNLQQMQRVAVDIFYTMKELELQILDLRGLVEQADEQVREEYEQGLIQKERRLAKLQASYASYVDKLFSGRLFQSDEDELILRMARVFGECEADAPREFVAEVKNYIDKWQASARLQRSIDVLQTRDYASLIADALKAQQLPPQFLYLALQESGFDPRAVGPMTRYGHAKGMWQFIPITAERFGLRLGPLAAENAYDPEDERHNVDKATHAAARYLREIYMTDAQASGLLVMASYNWGEGNILRRPAASEGPWPA